MRLGAVQRDVVAFLARNGGRGYIGAVTRAPEFRGLDLQQVERSISALMKRGVVHRVGIQYELIAATETGSGAREGIARYVGSLDGPEAS